MPFDKGRSGNPRGRQVEKPFGDALRMELAAAGTDHKALRAIAKQLIDKAESGDLAAIKELADRTDGKASQAVDVSGSINIIDQEDALAALDDLPAEMAEHTVN